MHSALAHDIEALLHAGGGVGAAERIARERAAVDEFLADPLAPPVYGFTTLLGHLDDTGATVADQAALLEAHLVGPVREFPAGWVRMLQTVKLAQLARGGSGLHPETHAMLARAEFDDDPKRGNWTTSYSSGDVVPGAWFVSALRSSGLELRHSGDLIALINGHFVSTTAALFAAERFSALVPEVLTVLRRAARRDAPPGVQRPVTLRDLTPVEVIADDSITRLLSALRDRLSVSGSNPAFVFTDAGARVESGSGFLDFQLTAALTQSVQTCAQLGAYLKAVVREASAQDPRSPSARVQPTKIAEALLREISEIALPTHFALSESAAVEDVADLSLPTARALARATGRLESILDLVSDALDVARSGDAGPLSTAIPLEPADKQAVLVLLAA